ncbi:hypothetical protein K491DRAFT_692781 [Lophiostoma macrostomum CBS 122681]|uniref:Uncharacterized protein n=1 Tax=Lophiostoma macrostomum CBS 122681 TaxID=1314788 RepID=A0A6A6T748_9PLEO|nr:hypothetical protein K491DRAFT_692781 [Lophiostoma macrostomum CBS 122681]
MDSTSDSLANSLPINALLHFPREIRDMIYPYILTSSTPISLTTLNASPHPLTCPETTHPIIFAEALEAFYTCNTFIVHTTKHGGFTSDTNSGPHPDLLHHQLRHLIVAAVESTSRWEPPSDGHGAVYIAYGTALWTPLLSFPRLQSLTIRMQKSHDSLLVWEDFAPILFSLRERLPNLRIRVEMSFDALLRAAWESAVWIDEEEAGPYQEMGFIDVTHLFEAPSREDREYVAEYLGGVKKMPDSPTITRGLLDCTAADRRLLGVHYVVKEPHLLSLLMQEKYEEFKMREGA